MLPTLWFRNVWSWIPGVPRPRLSIAAGSGDPVVVAEHADLGTRRLYMEGKGELLFTDNDTNDERLYGTKNHTPYVKDAFHRYLIQGQSDAINPAETGTKMAAHYTLDLAPGATQTIRLRLS